MDTARQQALVARILDHHRNGSQDLADAERYQSIEIYHEPGHAERERKAVIRRFPLALAHGSELPEAGDFITETLVGTPILAVRQADGGVRAFVNLCRHRATKVEWEASGSRRLFSCPYHAWTYERDGSLRNIPVQEQGFPCVDRGERGLVELPCEVRHGIVWVVLDPQGSIDVAAWLGGELDGELAEWGLGDAVQERIDRFENDFNWKLTVDGFLEGYHLRFLHSRTIGPYFMADLCLHDEWGPHTRMVPVRKTFEQVTDREPEEIDTRDVALPVWILFPATIVVWQRDHWELWTSFPDPADPARSIARARLLAPDGGAVDAERALWDKNWRILMDTVEREDWQAMKYTQQGLGAGASDVVFGRNEPSLQHFHRMIEQHTSPSP